jgi:hypothetical protein
MLYRVFTFVSENTYGLCPLFAPVQQWLFFPSVTKKLPLYFAGMCFLFIK